MLWIKFTIILLAYLTICPQLFAIDKNKNYKDATYYRSSLFGSFAKDKNTPFWLSNNQYGVVPHKANNGYLKAGLFHNQSLSHKVYWGAGLDLMCVTPRERKFYIQQAYAEIEYRNLLLSIGSKERYNSLWDYTLSSGDLVFSKNARPIPEVNISIPQFMNIPLTKGWLHIKGDFAVGRSFDKDYLTEFSKDSRPHINNILWHHKSFYIKIEDTKNNSPLSGILGVQHWAQWGGTSTNPQIGKQPHSFKDFIRVICGSEGSNDATITDQVNVLGNHYGSYDLKLSYTKAYWSASFYHQHFFEDKSGMIFKNKEDGLWGIQINLPQISWLKKIVFEYLITKNQSGPFHFIEFDHTLRPGHGGGRDDYYNNEEYTSGASYFNKALGSPLLINPEYNSDGTLGFKHNRIKDWHIGLEGEISPTVNYRSLFTIMNSWGKPTAPLLKKAHGTSSALDITYIHPHLKGWKFIGAIAFDTGTMIGNNWGCSFKIVKRGILKQWNK